MKNPFAKKPVTPEPVVAETDAQPKEEWDPVPVRDTVFQTLATRVGPSAAAELREDFDHHIEKDPVNGVEAAWMCLCGKLVETIDRFNDLLNGTLPGMPGAPEPKYGDGGDEPISPFTTFRKDG